MGMYTELVLAIEVKADTPESVLNDLRTSAKSGAIGKFSFFHRDSYYFRGDSAVTFRYDDIGRAWYLTLRCNLKNYNSEIENFCEWLCNYVYMDGDEFAGYKRYEEDPSPTLIYFTPKGVRYVTTTTPPEVSND